MKTYYGFPVDDGKSRDARQSGVALIIAMLAVSMIMIFSSNMIINSQVNLEIAVAGRDNLKSEYMAKSGYNMALFLLSADWGIDLFLASPQSPSKMDPSDGKSDIWNMMNGIPIGGDTLDLITATQENFSLSAVNDESILNILKLFDGQFTINIEDESSRININDCADGRCTKVLLMLEALMSCPAEKAFLEKKNVDGKALAYRIKDWVDKDSKASPESGFNDENDPYQKQTPPYSAKNVPFDSLDELKLIEGWDDDIHAIFSPYLTAYPYKKSTTSDTEVNFNNAKDELLACLIPESRLDCREKSAAILQSRSVDNTNLADSKSSINQVLQESFCYRGEGETGPNNKSSWFTNRSSVFRLETIGNVGDQEKKLVAVIERGMPDKAKKIEASYKILYWRML